MAGGVVDIMLRSIFTNRLVVTRNVSGIYCKEKVNTLVTHRFSSSSAAKDDPASYFLNEKVHKILRSLTRPDPKCVFRRRMDGFRSKAPTYKFMTDEELNKAIQRANQKMYELLQMPPILNVKSDDVKVISEDPEIREFDTSNYIFTDVTYGLKDKDRLISVREPTGKLRTANNDERKRMLQIYFPIEGREIFPPKMFFGEHLEDLLNRQEYEFILNRAAVQYDPNEAEWVRITHTVYDYINKERAYEKLLSTRFYGPMVFHFAWNQDIDNLLIQYLNKFKFEEAVWLVELYQLLNHGSIAELSQGDDLEFIMQYAEKDAKLKSKLKSTLMVCKEWKEEQKRLEDNIKKAHGIE